MYSGLDLFSIFACGLCFSGSFYSFIFERIGWGLFLMGLAILNGLLGLNIF